MPRALVAIVFELIRGADKLRKAFRRKIGRWIIDQQDSVRREERQGDIGLVRQQSAGRQF
jgi:hypothetical protein